MNLHNRFKLIFYIKHRNASFVVKCVTWLQTVKESKQRRGRRIWWEGRWFCQKAISAFSACKWGLLTQGILMSILSTLQFDFCNSSFPLPRHPFHKQGLGVGRSAILQVWTYLYTRGCAANNELESLKPEFRQESGWTEHSPQWILLCWKWFPGGIV